MHTPGANIVALDQEQHAIVAVINGAATTMFDPANDLDQLPDGGGVVVADENVWAVRNPLSQSQYCWTDHDTLDEFLNQLTDRGYHAVSVPNRAARNMYVRARYDQADAVRALAEHVHDRVADGHTDGPLWCGCRAHRRYDGGRPVRSAARNRCDRSYGQRGDVVTDFLHLQNDIGYDNAFLDAAVDIVHAALTPDQRDLLNLLKRKPCAKNRNRVAVVAVCTHDPWTGQLRTHNGQRWGRSFIRERVLGLNGTMQGVGARTAGNPMRAVLRSLGRGKKPERLNATDRAVHAALVALQQHPQLPAV
jgi:hypothetical protein